MSCSKPGVGCDNDDDGAGAVRDCDLLAGGRDGAVAGLLLLGVALLVPVSRRKVSK